MFLFLTGYFCECSCNSWYHKKCLNMDNKEYEALAGSSLSWICSSCGMPNFSFTSSFFELESLMSFDQNSFSPLKNQCHSDPILDSPLKSPFQPKRASTPPKRKPKKVKSPTKNKADDTCTNISPPMSRTLSQV